MLHIDRADCPAVMFVECHFRGGFKKDALQEAVEVAITRHPLFGCVARRRRGRWVWEPVPGWRPVVEWQPGARERVWPETRQMDITREPAFRITATERAGADGKIEATSLVWQVHHSLCDSVGINLMVEDILIAYARNQGQAVDFSELQPELLPSRNGFGLGAWDKILLIPHQVAGLLACYVLHRQKVATLTGTEMRSGGVFSSLPPAIISRRLTAEERRRVSEAAGRLDATSNDLFIRDFHSAIGLWRKEQGVGSSTDWLQLLVPVSLRRPADRFLPAVNVVSAISLSRSARTAGDRERLLRRTLEDMAWVKNKDLGFVFITLLWLRRFLPGGIRSYARRPGALGTATLSNMGQFFSRSPLKNRRREQEVPGAVLEDIKPSTPLQPGVAAVLNVAVYAGRLAFDLTYDRQTLTEKQAERLMELFLGQLRLSVEECAGPKATRPKNG